ncbi:hypothetical protein PPSIR1_13625 [Plesiocystis pacifica SIR-1]|uniref:PilZ domain-containing protein n=1 Tax=Plesiocystis pacifica SIR-1 TaxID=391625 RepID=A6GF25_9BACT|nr:PilZ domain-containing protein [Plesiocystis pacifica]EDM75552.1 hypothetical protein PPSIR1_13625 [Plesiocystis pacifica SIR-1]
METLSTEAPQLRTDARHVIGSFVAPGTQAGVMEGFMVVDLSRSGMSLLRVGAKKLDRDSSGDKRGRGLDHRFSWLAVPLPERGETLCALAEVVHRRRYGPLEWVGVRFEHMSAKDRATLDEYLAERDTLSFGANSIPAWEY